MNSTKQKKRLLSQTDEDSTVIATTKTQRKKLKQNNENVAVKSVESNTKKQQVGDKASEANESTAARRKRMKTKERKLAAIAKVKEAGGVPKPLRPATSKKSKLAKTTAQDSTTTDAVEKTPAAVSSAKGVRQVEEKLKKQAEKRLEQKILRKEKRQVEGQYKVENITLSIDEIKERINSIQSRGELTKTGKRKLGILKKKLAIADGTFVPQPPIEKKDSDTLSRSQKRKLKQKIQKSTADPDVEAEDSEPDAEKPVDIQSFKKKGKKNQTQEEQMKPVKKSAQVKSTNKLDSKSLEKNTDAATQVKLNGKKKAAKDTGAAKNKKIVQESKEDSDGEDEDEEESDSQDGHDNKSTVLNSKAKKAKLSSTHDIEGNDEDDDDDDDDEEEEDEDVAEEEAESDENDEEQDDVDDEEEDDEDDKEEDDEDDDKEENEDDSNVKGEAKIQKKGDAKSEKKTIKEPTENGNTLKKQSPQNQDQERNKRYILFVGNLPFDTKSDDLKNHFLTKVSEVISVRIPTKFGSPLQRGFGYVEVTNDIEYEKALSLHHSIMNGRRLNVEHRHADSRQGGQRRDYNAGKLAWGQRHDQGRSVRRFNPRNQDRRPY